MRRRQKKFGWVSAACWVPRVFAVMALATTASSNADERLPDIVLIMADDMGSECVGCYGGTSYSTPTIDRLARQGARFTHAYSQPLCTNTRLQLMTGRYNHRNWEAFGILPQGSRTIAHIARQAGYRTHLVGKWQLRSYDPPDFPNSERRRAMGMTIAEAGFDTSLAFHAGETEDKGSRYASPTLTRHNASGQHTETLVGRYGPFVFADRVSELLREETAEPKFIYYPMALPHRPFEPSPLSEDYTGSPPPKENPMHFESMMMAVDQCIARIVQTLENLGTLDETLVIFYSDNGTHQAITSRMAGGRNIAGGKGLMTQNGIVVPLIVHCPERIEPHVNDSLVDSTDFLATLAHWMQTTVKQPHDGVEFATAAETGSRSKREHVLIYFDPRPGWDKEAFGRQACVIDRQRKRFRDQRRFRLGPRPFDEVPVDALVSGVDDAVQWEALENSLRAWLRDGEPPLVDAYGDPISDGRED